MNRKLFRCELNTKNTTGRGILQVTSLWISLAAQKNFFHFSILITASFLTGHLLPYEPNFAAQLTLAIALGCVAKNRFGPLLFGCENVSNLQNGRILSSPIYE
ncbi:hypothetical protein Y032_0569g84 [Ancylostoma ceylanicum]|uniref:Uncharacterized protein n=1 Tax=Ancylostoma ceylanicum TaxID=53326 RepID=A0A016WQY4_9BILA|nr:hypothetical protein Y032_0569g84 [Ancylostoma ceylanicum]